MLLILVGSDISMMSALSDYRRPLYGRLTEMTVGPLSPAAIADMLELAPLAALDAYLVIGGFPRLAGIWRPAEDLWKFLRRELGNPESPLIVLGERSLAAELPAQVKAREALEAIGAGERVFTAILGRAGISNRTLESTLGTLIAKRVVEKASPYSAQPRRRLSRYTVSDPYLRFWLRFIRAGIPTLERGRGDILYSQIRASWPAFAGRAIEPVVRDAIEAALPDRRFGDAQFVGSFWNRENSIEIDLVGGDGAQSTDRVSFAGSIKWRSKGGFGRGDVSRLIEHRASLPGADDDTLLVGVSRDGFSAGGLDLELGPEQILAMTAGESA